MSIESVVAEIHQLFSRNLDIHLAGAIQNLPTVVDEIPYTHFLTQALENED
jgi:hypothetical protein